MDTSTVREIVSEQGLFVSGAVPESPIDSAHSGYGENYFSYSDIVDKPKPFKLPKSRLGNNPISMLRSSSDYAEFGNHIPIPCFDFFIRASIEEIPHYLLIKRGIWPMYEKWWPIGGRRLLPCFSEPSKSQTWNYLDEVAFKVFDDLSLSTRGINYIARISVSDHYHLRYSSESREKLLQRRVTPVTSFLVDITENAAATISKPDREAISFEWIPEQKLKGMLSTNRPGFTDHLRINFATILGCDFFLCESSVEMKQAI